MTNAATDLISLS